jgi:hypothetical protein
MSVRNGVRTYVLTVDIDEISAHDFAHAHVRTLPCERMQGAYLDLDVVDSKRRSLAKRLHEQVEARYLTADAVEQERARVAALRVVEGPE